MKEILTDLGSKTANINEFVVVDLRLQGWVMHGIRIINAIHRYVVQVMLVVILQIKVNKIPTAPPLVAGTGSMPDVKIASFITTCPPLKDRFD